MQCRKWHHVVILNSMRSSGLYQKYRKKQKPSVAKKFPQFYRRWIHRRYCLCQTKPSLMSYRKKLQSYTQCLEQQLYLRSGNRKSKWGNALMTVFQGYQWLPVLYLNLDVLICVPKQSALDLFYITVELRNW